MGTEEEPRIKIGMYNKKFQMASKEMLEERIETIRGRDANFTITAGPLIFLNKKYNEVYVLEIDYKKSEDAHRKTLPGWGFNSYLFHDYAEKAHELAQQFCDKNNFLINDYLNSWPEYQAIISKK
jgi:hypothetical protein